MYIEPNQVYLHTDHFKSKNETADKDVIERLQRLAHGLVFMHKQLKQPWFKRLQWKILADKESKPIFLASGRSNHDN